MITDDLVVSPVKKEERLITAKNDRIFKAIFVQKEDHHLMESILSECLGEEVKIIRYLKVELGVSNISERSKRLDVLIESKDKKMVVELNTEGPSVNNRNLAYLAKFYGTRTKINRSYKDGYKYILINLSYNVADSELKREYYLQDKTGKKYVEDLEVKEFIMDKITKECYDRIIEGKEIQYKHLAMLDLDKETLEMLSDDKIVKEYMDKLIDLNNDDVFIGPLRVEEDEKVIQNMVLEDKIKESKIEIAKKMLDEKLDLSLISKITGITEEEIEELK